MKKIPFDYFEEGQTAYLNISRIEELEVSTGKSIGDIVGGNMNARVLVSALMVGLKHHNPNKSRQFYQQKIDEFTDKGGSIHELWEAVVKMVSVSGLFSIPVADAVASGKEIETTPKNA